MNEYKLIVLFLKKEKLWLEFKQNLIKLLCRPNIEPYGWHFYIKEAFLNNKNFWISEIRHMIREKHHLIFSASEIMWNIKCALSLQLSETQIENISNIIENYNYNDTKP